MSKRYVDSASNPGAVPGVLSRQHRHAGPETRSSPNRSSTPRRGRSLNLATPSLAPLESASTRPASLPGFVPDDAHGPSGLSRRGEPGAVRASSPAGETGMSEPVGADLPEARDGEGQLSKDALRSPALGAALGLLYGIDVNLRHGNSCAYFGLPDDVWTLAFARLRISVTLSSLRCNLR